MALPVNFKDDVLASSMDGKRRYNMITNSDGTVSFEDVTTYSQEGSNFGSAQINNTNGAINTINNNVLDTIEQISANTSGGKFAGALALKNVNNSLVANSKHFYFDYKDGKYGYNTNPNRGADTFFPFSSVANGTFTFINGGSSNVVYTGLSDINGFVYFGNSSDKGWALTGLYLKNVDSTISNLLGNTSISQSSTEGHQLTTNFLVTSSGATRKTGSSDSYFIRITKIDGGNVHFTATSSSPSMNQLPVMWYAF